MVDGPERTCVVCRTKKPKEKLFRFLVSGSTSSPRGVHIVFDKEQSGSGRGFYVCSKECWDGAAKRERRIRIGSDAKNAKTISLPKVSFEKIIDSNRAIK